MTQEDDQGCVDVWRKRKRGLNEVKGQAIFGEIFHAGIRKWWKLSLSLYDPNGEATKTSDYKDYRMEKPSPLVRLISLLVKTETMTQTMSGADEFEKSVWKEGSEQRNCGSTNESNVARTVV